MKDQYKRVTFADNHDVFIIRDDDGGGDDEEDNDASTSQNDSFPTSKETMRECVCTWACTDYWKLLENTVDDEDGEAVDVQRYITAFARVEIDGDSPRGLERQICSSHFEARKALSDKACYAVLSADYKLRVEIANISDEEIWKELRNVYKKHSQGAKTFARKMGKADESAARRGPLGEETIRELIDEIQIQSTAGALRVKRRSHADRRSSRADKNRKEKFENELESSKDKQRKAPFRVSSLYTRRSEKQQSTTETSNEDSASELFGDVDKKGKTKMSARWKDFKKRMISNMTIPNEIRMH